MGYQQQEIMIVVSFLNEIILNHTQVNPGCSSKLDPPSHWFSQKYLVSTTQKCTQYGRRYKDILDWNSLVILNYIMVGHVIGKISRDSFPFPDRFI